MCAPLQHSDRGGPLPCSWPGAPVWRTAPSARAVCGGCGERVHRGYAADAQGRHQQRGGVLLGTGRSPGRCLRSRRSGIACSRTRRTLRGWPVDSGSGERVFGAVASAPRPTGGRAAQRPATEPLARRPNRTQRQTILRPLPTNAPSGYSHESGLPTHAQNRAEQPSPARGCIKQPRPTGNSQARPSARQGVPMYLPDSCLAPGGRGTGSSRTTSRRSR